MLSRKQVTVPMLHLKPKIDIIEEIPLNGHPPIDLSIKVIFLLILFVFGKMLRNTDTNLVIVMATRDAKAAFCS